MSPLEIQKYLQQVELNHLLNEDYVNTQFLWLQNHRNPYHPYYLVWMIHSYCEEMEKLVFHLRSSLELPYINSSYLLSVCRYMEYRSTCMGAEHVRNACTFLYSPCYEGDRRKFLENLECMYNDFKSTWTKLLYYAELEWKTVNMGGP